MSNEQDMRSRAKDHLPSVLLTLLSIVQALALQLLWEHVPPTLSCMCWTGTQCCVGCRSAQRYSA